MTIQRRYQPDAAAFDELVEALYQLLMDGRDGPETPDSATSATPAPPRLQNSNE
jgi:hypothetical protein